jgi:hypothetical protein
VNDGVFILRRHCRVIMIALGTVGRRIAKVHSYIFYVYRISFKAVLDDGWENEKAILIISMLMLSSALIIENLISLCVHRLFIRGETLASKILIIAIAVGVTFFNVNTLISRGKWKECEREFQMQSNAAKVRGAIVVWIFSVLLLIATFYTAHFARELVQ